MAEITAALVKQLREMTDSPMMECKKALVEAEGDIDKAIDVLRAMGVAKSIKKAGRATNEGAIAAYVSEDGKLAALAEVKCETDFVSNTDKFKALVSKIAQAVAECDPQDADAFKAATVNGETVESIVGEGIHNMGENMTLGKFARCSVENGAISSYIHMGGKIGTLVVFSFDKPETAENETFKVMAHDIAMQVAAAKPLCANRDEMPQATIDHEMEIYRAQAADSGKPKEIQEKMALGRLEKFYQEATLVDEAFVKDPEIKVSDLIKRVAKEVDDKISVKGFKLFVLGE
ncbi:MAG: translation elongation factor Ts [Coriobacteriales bacterium]|nr:translation elongation factor Ts [Coriobacteriales bacterium]